MFPSKLFSIDPKTKSIIGEAARLGTIRGPGAIFEDLGNETFGLEMITNRGVVSKWSVVGMIEAGTRLTFVLKSNNHPDHKMIVMENFNA